MANGDNETMLTDYIQSAMQRATYRTLDNDEGIWGEVPDLEGTWACEPTYPQCQKELQSVVESWILVKLKLGHTIPVLDGIDLNLNLQAVEVA
jgi:predicted RNase H-like HicB family nuclease